MSDGIYCITEPQRRAHIASEAAALAVVVPFTLWLATRRELPVAARALSAAIGATSLVIDGVFLARYLTPEAKSASGLGSTSRSHPPSPLGPSGQLSHPQFP